MDEQMAIALIENRFSPDEVKTLGYFSLVLSPGELKQIEAGPNYYFHLQADPLQSIEIASEFGYYRMPDPASNELHFEHQGSIRIKNLDLQQPAILSFLSIQTQ